MNVEDTELEYGRDRIVGEVQLARDEAAGEDAEVRVPPMPAIPVGDSDASGYCVLSGSGAPEWSWGTVSLEKTPACENG